MKGRQRPAVAIALEEIRSGIRNGKFAGGEFLPPETGLASEFGVGRGSVRQAIDILVSTGELTRKAHSRPIIGLAKERTEAREGQDVFVWVSHPISDSASLMFMKGVSLSFRGTPYRMIVREPTRFFGQYVAVDERQMYLDVLESDRAVGAIVHRDPYGSNDDLALKLLRLGKPLVFVDSTPSQNVPADHVGTNNRGAARRCVEHLVEMGHRNILCLMENLVSPVHQDRVKGYQRAMTQAGLDGFAECLVAARLEPGTGSNLGPAGRFAGRCAVTGAYLEWAQRLVHAVLTRPVRPTALFISCDVLAHSVGALLEGAGLRIPADISIVGFDWLARWETEQPDDLTTASQDFEGFGWHAADILLDRLAGGGLVAPRHVLLPAPLVIRSSTGLPPVTELATDLKGNAAIELP